jgi:hypothetical protein
LTGLAGEILRLDVRNYANRIRAAKQVDPTSFQSEGARELLRIYDGDGHMLESPIASGAAHQFGLIHKTVDVLLVLPDRRFVIQQRSFHDPILPGAYSLSAGGHFGLSLDPISSAIKETQEELSFQITDASRLVPLHDTREGWPLYFATLVYHGPHGNLKVMKTAPDAPYRSVPMQTSMSMPFVSRALLRLEKSTPWNPQRKLDPELEIKEVFFNQEFTYYYVLPVSEREFSDFSLQENEVANLERITLTELEELAWDDLRTTDTLLCLKAHDAFRKLDRILQVL